MLQPSLFLKKGHPRESVLRAFHCARSSPSDLHVRSAPGRFYSRVHDPWAAGATGATSLQGFVSRPRVVSCAAPLRSREPRAWSLPGCMCVPDGSAHWSRTTRAASRVRETPVRALFLPSCSISLPGLISSYYRLPGCPVALAPHVSPRLMEGRAAGHPSCVWSAFLAGP